ncbi:transporter substrate-binding domain-containing protein [Variovorax sp. YR216]|uniref:transporter substrate-binding domain-containing protein n=1 Tax=Variovorax sp. YR216 TaxID=1882828 RepID=UPI00089BB34B|nr:transporter substrate-binding domain-containing protein [Variovorax sp. YR216]SEB23483.1 polar amino acid transport system substrate-binding protein [Variovorax sp. YR216]
MTSLAPRSRLCIAAIGAAAGLSVLAAAAVASQSGASGFARWVLRDRTAAELPRGPVLEHAARRGVLVVGVRSYPRPAPPGAPTPAEPDSYDLALAGHLATKLGLRLEAVGLAPGEQETALRAQRVDLVVAGTPDGPPGHDIVDTDGSYDTSPGTLVALRSGRLRGSGDLAGAAVCVPQGSGYAGTLAGRYGAQPRTYPSSVHAASAFMAGECQALADHGDVIERLLRNEEWRFYRAIARGLAPEADSVIRIASGDKASREWLSAAMREWRIDGEQDRARNARVGNVQFEVGLLKDGLVCHS